jgi:general stress protein YciG
MADEKKGGMTVAEAGRKGGVKVAQERGRAFYEQIGKKGGETVKAERGHEFYEKIGKKGGESVRASRGPEFYSMIGHKGGQKVRELIEQGKRLGKANAAKAAAEIVESSSDDQAPAGATGMNAGRGEE